MYHRLYSLTLYFCLAISTVPSAIAQQYTVTPLNGFTANGNINNQGTVAGFVSQGMESGYNAIIASLRYSDGTLLNLGTLPGDQTSVANWVNDFGWVTGYSQNASTGTRHAFLCTNGVMTDLGTLPGDVSSSGLSVNYNGTVIGTSTSATNVVRSFTYNNGTMTALPVGFLLYANNNFEVGTGTVPESNSTFYHAMEFQYDNFIDMSALPVDVYSDGLAINDAGQITGGSWSAPNSNGDIGMNPFLYFNGTSQVSNGAMQNLGALPGAPYGSYGAAINNCGVVVGANTNTSFVYNNGVIVDLNTISPSAWHIGNAYSINDSGIILANAYVANSNRTYQSVTLTPVGFTGYPANEFCLAPTPLTIPSTVPGQTTEIPLFVKNLGTENLGALTIALTGSSAASFHYSSVDCSNRTIVSYGGCFIQVTFEPSAVGSYSAMLEVTDRSSGISHSVPLSGIASATP